MANQPETFRGHLPALAGSLIGTLLSAVIGSHIGGALGTRYALIFGAFVSGSASWWAERAIRRSQTVAQAKIKAAKAKGAPLSVTETQAIEVAQIKAFERKHSGVPYRLIAVLSLTALAGCLITVFALDAFGARSVASITPEPVPTVTRFVTPSPSIVTVPPAETSIPASATPTIVPASVTPTMSGTGSATPSPFADSSPTISATPTATGATP